jgi:tetratricopeptide (TPR) repeat protein
LRPLALRVPALAVLLAILTCGQARAQNPSPEGLARRHYDRGTTLYNLGQFEEAIAEYRKGYEQKADPVFLLNIGEAYRQLGVDEKALFFYRRYLTSVPDAPNRAQIEEKIASLEQLVAAEQRARSPAPPQPLSPTTGTAPSLVPPLPAEPYLTTTPPPPSAHAGPYWHRWWFWAGAGGLVAGGIAVGLLVSSARQPKPPATDLGTKRFF